MRHIELLAPARDAACGMAAIDHGADAVYIGAQRFGARAAAGNTVDDIAALCHYAHRYGAKVYVTLNTIVYDSETDVVRRLIEELSAARVDALLVQDMAVAVMAQAAGLPVHASTQTDNRTADKVRWLKHIGFNRAVLARELCPEEIRAIHSSVPDIELEAFVHGALCVSYSGQCYASQHCFGRSANRGECAQLCRMAFDLVDGGGRRLCSNRHLLSLKDMCRIDSLETLLDAGVTSLKIEGRLKDMAYVKNITAAYSERLNNIIRRRPADYRRASFGHCTYTFAPDVHKTFNRGYTDYFVGTDGRRLCSDIASPDTPKAIGQSIGRVRSVGERYVIVDTTATLTGGDGLCFFDDRRRLQGFRVNSAEGDRLLPYVMPKGLRAGKMLYRNHDHAFAATLARKSAERRIAVTMSLTETADGYALTITAADGALQAPSVTATVGADSNRAFLKQDARTPQNEIIRRQLTKLGATVYECTAVSLPDGFRRFIPSGLLTEMRRQATEAMDRIIASATVRADSHRALPSSKTPGHPSQDAPTLPIDRYVAAYPYLLNVANDTARRLYREEGAGDTAEAFELPGTADNTGALLMQCRHCLRREMGHCTKDGTKDKEWREPLYLVLGDGRRLRLGFDCRACQMNVYAV